MSAYHVIGILPLRLAFRSEQSLLVQHVVVGVPHHVVRRLFGLVVFEVLEHALVGSAFVGLEEVGVILTQGIIRAEEIAFPPGGHLIVLNVQLLLVALNAFLETFLLFVLAWLGFEWDTIGFDSIFPLHGLHFFQALPFVVDFE